jgi:hypothetical protein
MFSVVFFELLYWVGISLTVAGVIALIVLFASDAGRKRLW